ncbi:type IV pilus modification PilV family protein [Planococcus soli]|uniref:type IV pilus modification PilV family protein n=1 Tax=Planococcus soli TaxID=2666072 RepID=UPI00163D967B|nr:type II secretion system protein [Planococcus soli]
MKNERGFTLVEVLAALVILSIVLMSFMAVFANTNRIAVNNSEKLVIINLADAYLERVKINPTEFIGKLPPTMVNCPPPETAKKCATITVSPAPPPINGKSYSVTLQIKQDLNEKSLLLLSTVVTVKSPDTKVSSSVEGYVSYEK